MSVFADHHDAFEWWDFAADWFIAVGTVGAVVVAIVLAMSASRRDRKTRRDERLRAARRVVVVYRPPGVVGPPLLTVLNSGSEVITRVHIEVHSLRLSDADPILHWEWDEQSVAERSEVSYIQAGEIDANRGSFWPESRPAGQQRMSVLVPTERVRTLAVWTDSHGDVWARQGSEEPYPSNYSVPGIDAHRAVPKRQWPDWWPDTRRASS